jgi:hypothetical protein
VPKLEDDKEGVYALRRIPGRFYVSRRFPEGGKESDIADPRICRFAYQVVDESGEILFESESGWEVVLRETETRQQLKALFFEDSRVVQYLSFQRFNGAGKRLRHESFVLSGSEVRALASYLALVRSSALDLAESEEGIRLLPEGVDALLADEGSRLEVFRRYRDAFANLFEADVQSREIVAFARRRQQLQVFETLLNDPKALVQRRASLKVAGRRSGPEDVWQDFFESNQWIFGFGLAPQFLHAWNPERLEQAVVGPSVFGRGKRPDALMRTAGVLSALAFVEIKHSATPLLHATAYRPGTWRVSDEVAGGVAQCQATVDEVVRRAEGEIEALDAEGFSTGERALVCRPRSLLVVGSLDQFVRDEGPNVGMFKCFERFRRSLRDPEILTFDELYARAVMSLALADESASPAEASDPGEDTRTTTWTDYDSGEPF